MSRSTRHAELRQAIAPCIVDYDNIIAVVQGKYLSRVGLLAALPLALQMFTGLYLFVLPFATKWGSGRRAD